METKLQRATHEGVLSIADIELDVAVLEDGTRVIHNLQHLRP